MALSALASREPLEWQLRTRRLSTADHTLIMGVLNATSDSFSDGGLDRDAAATVARGLALWEAGADIVDVGGESTRPGSMPVDRSDELRRVIPVVAALAAAGVCVSVDTMKPVVAAAALAEGAEAINDVSGLRDPEMMSVVAGSGAGVVLMHMRGLPATMQENTEYDDVVADVIDYLSQRAAKAIDRGIVPNSIVIDPGIGFGKTVWQNLELLDSVSELCGAGFPVLIGASRKGFLGAILAAAGRESEAAERDYATAATVSTAIVGGASIVRVHNVAAALQVARTTDAIVRGQLESRETIGRT